MNVVAASRPPGPVTWTLNRPSRIAPGKSCLIFSWKVPADGVTRTVRVNFCAGATGGGLLKLSATVTGWPGSKPLARATHASPAVPWLCFTMHPSGPPPAGPDEPHAFDGAGGRPPGSPELEAGVGVLELLSAEPRMTPTTTRAAPTEAQPAQAMCARTQRRQPEPGCPPVDPVPGPARPWAALCLRAGRKEAGSSV